MCDELKAFTSTHAVRHGETLKRNDIEESKQIRKN